MDLERSWRRKIFQATGAGIVAPSAVVAAAIAVGVGGGGIRGLGSLGQTLRGPAIPVAEASEPAPTPAASERLLERAIRRESATTRAVRTAARKRRREQQARARRRARKRTSTAPQATAGVPAPTAAVTPTQGGATATPPPPQPSAIRQLGDQVKEVTDQVPIAGETAGQVVDVIVDTADEVLPKQAPPVPATAATPATPLAP